MENVGTYQQITGIGIEDRTGCGKLGKAGLINKTVVSPVPI